MKFNSFGFALLFAFLVHTAHAGTDSNAEFCYLPTKSNVAYNDVLAFQQSSPAEVISYGEGDNQFAELWLPNNLASSQKAPLVAFVHGGCWSNAYDIEHSQALSTALSKMGYAVWSIEYNRAGDEGGGWPGSLDDISLALDYIPELQDYAIDLRKIALVGHSAGGHLALLAGANRKASLRGVIGLAAIVDIVKYSEGTNSCQTLVAPFMGGSSTENTASYAAANPINAPLHSNSVLIHGDKDSIVPISQAQNTDLKLLTVPGAGHFDMIHPETNTFQVLLKELATIFK
jgi:acetyl esterase/lipase